MERPHSEGVVKLERLQVICPACGQQVEAVASNRRVRGYCAVAKQSVNFLIETQRIGKNPAAETMAKISASVKKRWQDPEVKDGVVRDYLAGDKAIVIIQNEYGISPGTLYRILHDAHAQLRTDDKGRFK